MSIKGVNSEVTAEHFQSLSCLLMAFIVHKSKACSFLNESSFTDTTERVMVMTLLVI